MADIYTLIDEMIELCRRKIETMGELKRLLRIADLLGVKPKEIKGPVRSGTYNLDPRSVQRWRGFVLRITYDGETREFPLKDVHLDLWPADLRAEYERHMARTRRKET